MKLFLALVSSLVLASCSSPPSSPCRTWHVAADFSEAEYKALELATVRWNVAVGKNVLSVERGSEPFCRVETMRLDLSPDSVHGATKVGHYEYVTISLAHTDEETFEIAALHEFGHSLGLDHIGGWGIMTAVQGPSKITEADAEEARRAGWSKARAEE